ncbi:hypothetical protein AB0O01_30540 [Streptomyces sp. NPDC093252]|uniref:DUF7144 family membrane protein n=1 Tax=Streptomyces sp. NPDC093252 TaxID=3154980 RepID=UPI0034482EB8
MSQNAAQPDGEQPQGGHGTPGPSDPQGSGGYTTPGTPGSRGTAGSPGPQDSEVGDAWSARPPRPPHTGNDAWVTGGVTFAGVLLLVSGVLAILQGISAIAKDDVYTRVGTYVYEINLTGWGWIHLVLGVLVALTGWGVLSGAAWGRIAGIVLASLSLIFQFLFLPYAPVWSVVVMAIDVFVIWALASRQETAHRGAHSRTAPR